MHQTAAVAVPPSKDMREKTRSSAADLEMSETRWTDFLQSWNVYNRSSGISGQDVLDDLWLCLSDSLHIEVLNLVQMWRIQQIRIYFML